jgi:hypothetical protein
MTGWIKCATALAVAAFVGSATTPSFAQDSGTTDARREALLKQMLARPNDLDLAFEYAKLSSDAGDYEGAISTLERMLIYAPNTPRIQLERGGMFQGWIAGPNKALIAFLYGKHLSIARSGHLYTLNETGKLFDISHPGRRSSGRRHLPIPVSCSPRCRAGRSNMRVKSSP